MCVRVENQHLAVSLSTIFYGPSWQPQESTLQNNVRGCLSIVSPTDVEAAHAESDSGDLSLRIDEKASGRVSRETAG